MDKNGSNHLYSADGSKCFEYYAFISYKHQDMDWAVWLQKKLETYRLPAHLCKAPSRPKRLCPICRDQTDFKGGGPVHEEIRDKIERSKFLIVICSKNMQTTPEYINSEIQDFLACGNPVNHILPFVVDGEGCAADPSNEAFPPALLEMGDARPLGVTLDRKKKHDSILNLVASMQGIEIQTIRSHDHDRRQKRFMLALGAGLLAALALGALMTWEFMSVKQAQLREQNVYAWEAFEQGDRIRAQARSEAVLAQKLPLMDEAILQNAQETRWLASMHPALSSLTLLENMRGDKEAFFDLSGERIIVKTEDRIRAYSLTGDLIRESPASLFGLKYMAVSPNGDYAVALAAFEDGDQAALWLCSLETGARIRRLVSSGAFDRDELASGRYDNVVAAQFSPDGAYVAAYRTGGYYNASENLELFDGKTGEVKASLDAALLGSSGQGNVVQDFEFASASYAVWEGPENYVNYNLETGETAQVSLGDMEVKKGSSQRAAGRLLMQGLQGESGEYSAKVLNFAPSGAEEAISYEFPLAGRLDAYQSAFFGSHYAWLCAADESGFVRQVLLVDTDTMGSLDLTPQSCKHATVQLLSDAKNDVYFLYLTDGKSSRYGDVLIRLDLNAGEVLTWECDAFSAPVTFAGRAAGADWLLAQNGKGTVAIKLSDDQVMRFALEEVYDAFYGKAQINATGEYLLAGHDGQYAVYPLQEPGSQMDADLAWGEGVSCLAASADGSLILKAQGSRIAAFAGDELLWQAETQSPILSANVSGDASRVVYTDGRTIHLVDRSGGVLAAVDVEADYTCVALHLTPSGDRVIAAETMPLARMQGARMRILDGSTLEHRADCTGLVYDESGAAAPAFELSPNGDYIAAIIVVGYQNGPLRMIALYDAKTGELLACSDNYNLEGECDILDMRISGMQIPAFSYVHFAQNGELLAGMNAGVWTIDPAEKRVIAFTAVGEDAVSDPEKLPNGDILYPASDLYILREGTSERKAVIPCAGNPNVALSRDGRWIILTDGNGVSLISAEDAQTIGKFSNADAGILYLDDACAVYSTEAGLYTMEIEGGNEQ